MVYTFSKIEDAINLSNNNIKEGYMEAIVSDIKTAYKLQNILKEFYKRNKSIINLKFKI